MNEMIDLLERHCAIQRDLAPLDKRGKPILGIRRYPESFHDNEWEVILAALKTYTGAKAT